MKSIVFIAQGMYARFRCPYTTTSALTYLVIHPIAVKGMIGAIMGIEYSKLYEYTNSMRIGIQVLNPVYKDMQSFNLIAMKNNNGAANFQSRVQFLRDVKYRIFVSDIDEKLLKIEKVLKKGNYIFTPYLGCSEHVARLKYEGTYETEKIDFSFCDTLIPKVFAVFNEDKVFDMYFDRIPVKNSPEREYVEYKEIVFVPGESIKVSGCNLHKVGEYYVFYF